VTASVSDAEARLVHDFTDATAGAYGGLVVAFHDSLSAALGAVRSDAELPRVDAVFETALPLLQEHLAVLEPYGWSAGVSGAFVHGGGGRYLADWPPGPSCEVADLLVVVEVGRALDTARTAILIQAKKPMEPPARPWKESSGPRQLALYEQTPEFHWDPAWVARYYEGHPRSFSCTQHGSWATQLGHETWADPRAVFAVLSRPRPWVVPPLEPMGQPTLLAAVLADLVGFRTGHPFQRLRDSYTNPFELEWSAVIWDLLQASLRRTHYHQTVPDRAKTTMLQDEGPEGQGYEAMDAFMRDRPDKGDNEERHPPDALDDRPGGGVSVVRLVVTALD
jgi:hypothetical protein